MPDISMCKNTRCPLNDSCYRYLATPSRDSQSYMLDLEPIINEDGDASCEYYWGCEPCEHCKGVEYHKKDCITLAHLV